MTSMCTVLTMDRNRIMCLILMLCFVVPMVTGHADVEYIANNIQPKFSVVTNWPSDNSELQLFEGELAITNAGNAVLNAGDWQIFFCHIRLFEPEILTPNYTQGIPVGKTGLEIYHINGCLYKLEPTDEFSLPAGQTKTATIMSSDWMVSRTDVMPNWYVTTTSGSPIHTIVHTIGEELKHAGEFDLEEKWKRMETDTFNPPTAEDRYNEYAEDEGGAPDRVVPHPLSISLQWNTTVQTDNFWKIVNTEAETANEAIYFADKRGWEVVAIEPTSKFVSLVLDPNALDGTECADNVTEAYHIEVTENPPSVVISAVTNRGIFYGIQTSLSILDLNGDNSFFTGSITDCPRFPFRGLMIDVSRNFVQKQVILDMLDVMASYKLNKFHFHLTDDEGWRLEIPGLPELTEIGGERCHDLEEMECIIPQLGSIPINDKVGSGFYSVSDYREILEKATQLHIEVIPEFDMPGHAHAAIKAMEARYNTTGNDTYLLSDLEDKSQYYSSQHFWDSALNPCIPSTATFIIKVIKEVRDMHNASGHPLSFYHFGGDEVPPDAWKGSPQCQQLMEEMGFENNADIKRYFFETVVNASIEVDPDLGLGSWEDGVMDENSDPFPKNTGTEVYTNCWSNVWEWGHGDMAYKFANADYKVVLSHATHLYMDHPQEPDPHDRGYYWATRFTGSEKTFGYMPDDIFANIEIDRMGNPITKDWVCEELGCTELEPDKAHNIIGMQGQLFSETTRSEEILQSMVFTRFLSFAERAWHKASWENMDNVDERETERREDWVEFANLLGYHELSRLGGAYHLRPPGATTNGNGELVVRTEFPGLPVEYSINSGAWQEFSSPVALGAGTNKIQLRTKSAEGNRYSVETSLTHTMPSRSARTVPTVYSLTVLLFTIVLLKR